MVGGDWGSSWRRVRPRASMLLMAGQLAAARDSASFIPAALDEQGISAPQVQLNPRAFVGFTSSGLALEGLLDQAVVKARVGGSLTSGGSWLDTVVETTLADTSRASEWVAIAPRPRVGWVRQVNAPCCA